MLTSRKNIVLGMLCAVWPVVANGQTDLSGLITRAADNSELKIGEGTYKLPITIDRPLSLKGDNAEKCVLEVTADQPAFTISGTGPVTIESMTIKWQLATSEGGRKGPGTAVLVKDGNVTLRNCRVIALGNGARCPMAVASTGFSKVSLQGCRFDGFEFTIGYSGGAEGSITDCQVLNPGHCGITVSSDSKIEVARSIVTGSKYHGLRCTGGTLIATDNLIVANKNRGIYLGNKSASGRVSNNVIMGNATGVGAFAQSDVTIENNLILDSSYAGLGSRDSCRLKIRNNLFAGNTRGIVVFEDIGKTQLDLGRNSFWDNKTTTENFELPKTAILADPRLAGAIEGNFVTQAEEHTSHHQGLTNAKVIQALWQSWKELDRK